MSRGTRGLLPRVPRNILGDSAARSLFPVQAFHSAGESLFALSLVGSLFFNVTVDAARPRILLYLALTMAPFAVLAPLIGPFIDRVRGGPRWVLVLSVGTRAAVALVLAGQLKTLLLYPLAFLIVVMAKVYVVSRNALVPSIVADHDHLVIVNSRLARVGTIAGLVGLGTGVAILQIGDAAWVLRAGAVFYGLGALMALRVPAGSSDHVETSPIVEATEIAGRGITKAWTAMAGLRFATGFVFFHIGFSLKTSGQPIWLIGVVGVAAPVGAFAGTFLAPILRRHRNEQTILTGALLAPTLAAGLAALRFHGLTVIALTFTLGLAGSVGRRAFDGVVQTEAPHARRGRAYSGLETRLELAWVVGSIVAVFSRSADWLGLLMLGAFLLSLCAERIADDRRVQAASASTVPTMLPVRLLETSKSVAAWGDYQQALLIATAAADAATRLGWLTETQWEQLNERLREAVESPAHPDNEREELFREVTDLVVTSAPAQ